jgi:N utilization substance protein B
MGTRRRSRELAMQALFFMDVHHDFTKDMFERFCIHFKISKKALSFFMMLTRGVVAFMPEIDGMIERFSDHWAISRMSCVDRNVMRVAVFEMLWCNDIPPKVSINEAVDIGKKFGTEESGAFINGIVDSIRSAMEKGEIASRNLPDQGVPDLAEGEKANTERLEQKKSPTFYKINGKHGVVKKRSEKENFSFIHQPIKSKERTNGA